jgi:hypothetical protein
MDPKKKHHQTKHGNKLKWVFFLLFYPPYFSFFNHANILPFMLFEFSFCFQWLLFFFFFWRSRSYLFSHENVGGKACLGGCNCDSCIKFVWFILFFIKKNMGAEWFCCFIIVNTSSSMQTTLVSKQKFSGMCPLPPPL